MRGRQRGPDDVRATHGPRLMAAAGIAVFVAAFVASCWVATPADAATITVNPGGSIQSGINSAAAGDTVFVRAGSYTGGINLNRSVKVVGEVLADGTQPVVNGNNNGQAVNIACSDCGVENMTFVDFEYGIGADNITGRNRVTLRNNIQRRTNYGFWISGDDWVVEGNEVDRIIRRSAGGDADYGRIFGNRHVVRRNWFHGTQIPTDLAPGPDYAHTDGLQYYNQNGEILRDILIEENIFSEFVQGLFIGNETGNGSAVQRITVRNNVFWGTTFPAAGQLLGSPSWCLYFGKNGPERQIVIENNIIRNCSNALGILTGTDAIVRRNIVANGGSVWILEGTSPSLITTTPGGNIMWANNWIGEMSPTSDITNVNPQFQNAGAVNTQIVGPDGIPWTTDDAWRPMNAAAQAFGPQVQLGGGGDPLPNRAPVANPDSFGPVPYNSTTAAQIGVLVNDSDPDGDALLVASVGSTSAGGTVSIIDDQRSVLYTPPQGFSGVDTFNYTVSDLSGLTATANVQVTVAPPPAVANAGEDRQWEAAEGTTSRRITLDASASTPGVEYQWRTATGSTVFATTATWEMTQTIAQSPRTYRVRVRYPGSGSTGWSAYDFVTHTVVAFVPEPDIMPPTITLNGDPVVALSVGDAWTDPGATAFDDRDGDITGRIAVAGGVDVATAGTYVLTYTVSDAAGLPAEPATRTVIVASVPSGGGITAEQVQDMIDAALVEVNERIEAVANASNAAANQAATADAKATTAAGEAARAHERIDNLPAPMTKEQVLAIVEDMKLVGGLVR